MTKFRVSIIFFFFFFIKIYAQNAEVCKLAEDSVIYWFQQIKSEPSDSVKLCLNKNIWRILENNQKQPGNYSFNFDSLKQFGKIISPDKSFKIITWNIIFSDGTYGYYGLLLKPEVKNNSILAFPLIDKATDVDKRENSVLSAGKWYGGLYYYILKNKVNQQVYYTLLALRNNDLFTTSKIIEILYFDEFDNPVFGAPLFQDGKDIKLRKVFEYTADVAMNLRYDLTRKMIIFDHISPMDDRYKDQYQNCGPDLSFDGYSFKNNMWQLVQNIEMVKPAQNKITHPASKKYPVSNKVVR
jgi:hypothetical protein